MNQRETGSVKGKAKQRGRPFPLPREGVKEGFESDSWVRTVQSLVRSSFTKNRSLRLFKGGQAAYEALFEAIGGARDLVALEFYIFRDDQTGWALGDLLQRKAREGVKVYLIYDHFGCRGTASRLWRTLSQAGVQVRAFHPPSWISPAQYLHRDHRKLVIIDGRQAFTGGVNIGDEYRGYFRKKLTGWRDTAACIKGPIAASMLNFFEQSWRECDREATAGARLLPDLSIPSSEDRGELSLIPLFSASRASMKALQRLLHLSILTARKSIHITVAYFIPPRRIVQLLCAAARRGVDVKLILPGESDLKLTSVASRAFYPTLLREGVQLYHYRSGILHAKTMLFDGCWAILGSANLDARSFSYNYESGIGILDREVGHQMEEMFREDLESSVPVTREEIEQYPFWERLAGSMLLRFRSYL